MRDRSKLDKSQKREEGGWVSETIGMTPYTSTPRQNPFLGVSFVYLSQSTRTERWRSGSGVIEIPIKLCMGFC